MAVQTALRFFVSKACQKCAPSFVEISRTLHISTNKISSTQLEGNIKFCTPYPVVQNKFVGEAGTSSSVEKRKLSAILCASLDTNQFLDLDLLKPSLGRMYTPSTSLNKTKIYEEVNRDRLKTITDPLLKDWEVIYVPVPGPSVRKEAHRMINIRKRKMRVHKRKKLWRKMRFVWEKMRQKRELRRETEFRIELLTEIDKAQSFSAEKHVKGIIDRLKYHKPPPSAAERYEQYRQLIKKNKSNTMFIMPRFDDD